jgi:hypothetical protein
MRKFFLLFYALLTLIISSCNKDDDAGYNPNDFEKRLEGSWNLQQIHYNTEIPDFSGGEPTQVDGKGQNVFGNITLNKNPNTFEYNFIFTANLIGFPLPLVLGGSGTWTTYRDNSKVVLRDAQGEETVFLVLINESKRQVYSTTLSQNLAGLYTVEIDLELEFTRP